MIATLTLTVMLFAASAPEAAPPPRLSLLEPAAGLNLTDNEGEAPAFQLPVQVGAALLSGASLGFAGYMGGAFGSLILFRSYSAMYPAAVVGASLGAAVFAPIGVIGASALMGVGGNPGMAFALGLAGAAPAIVLALVGPIADGPVFVGSLVASGVLTTVGAVVGFNWKSSPTGMAVAPTVMPTSDGMALGVAAAW